MTDVVSLVALAEIEDKIAQAAAGVRMLRTTLGQTHHSQPTARFVRPKVFEQLTGYTAKAIEHKIARGVWIEGKQYRRAPDGNILVDMEDFNKWVAGEKGLV